MARIRAIKPEFFTSETLASLPMSARLTFAGLLTYADDEGRGRDNAKLVKAAVWALDDSHGYKAVESDLAGLAGKGLIIRYAVDDKSYLQIVGWEEHQRVSHPTGSKFPCPPENFASPPDTFAPEQGTGNREGNREQGTGKALAIDRFEDFWSIYPRKEGKGAAAKAWAKAITRCKPEVIVLGAERYRDDPNRDAAFTKHPTTWLNADCWSDAPLPSRSTGSQHPNDAYLARALAEGRAQNG